MTMRTWLLALIAVLAPYLSAAADTPVSVAPLPMLRFVDNKGNACSGCKLFTYAAGTTTKLASYTDSTGTTPQTNPVVLNSRGEASIWLAALAYKIVLSFGTDSDPPTNPIWTVDHISPASNPPFGMPGFTFNTGINGNTVSWLKNSNVVSGVYGYLATFGQLVGTTTTGQMAATYASRTNDTAFPYVCCAIPIAAVGVNDNTTHVQNSWVRSLTSLT